MRLRGDPTLQGQRALRGWCKRGRITASTGADRQQPVWCECCFLDVVRGKTNVRSDPAKDEANLVFVVRRAGLRERAALWSSRRSPWHVVRLGSFG